MEEKLNTAERISPWSEMKFFTLPPQYHSLGWMTQNNRAEWRALRSVQGEGKYLYCWKQLQRILKARGALSASHSPTISATFHRTMTEMHQSLKQRQSAWDGGSTKSSDLEILPDFKDFFYFHFFLHLVWFCSAAPQFSWDARRNAEANFCIMLGQMKKWDTPSITSNW